MFVVVDALNDFCVLFVKSRFLRFFLSIRANQLILQLAHVPEEGKNCHLRWLGKPRCKYLWPHWICWNWQGSRSYGRRRYLGRTRIRHTVCQFGALVNVPCPACLLARNRCFPFAPSANSNEYLMAVFFLSLKTKPPFILRYGEPYGREYLRYCICDLI